MAHSVYLWGVRIYIPVGIATDATVGLYNASATSCELRWVEAEMTGASAPTLWSSHMLLEKIEPLAVKADFSRGGAPVQVDGTTIHAANHLQLSILLAEYGVALAGLKAEIWEFTCVDYVESSRALLFTGVIGDPTWTELELTIPVEEPSLKRRANIGTLISNGTHGNYPNAADVSNGVMIPATFGQLTKAKMVGTAKAETIATNTDIVAEIVPTGLKQFPVMYPVSSTTPTLTYRIALGTAAGTGAHVISEAIEGKYLHVVSGKGSGAYRLIETCTDTAGGSGWEGVELTVASYFEETLQGNDTATATDQSWVEIVDVDGSFKLDVWPCNSFLDDAVTPSPITMSLDLFTYDEPVSVDVSTLTDTLVAAQKDDAGFYPLPHFAYVEESTSSDHNAVDIDSKQFNGSAQQVDSVLAITPSASDISLIDDSDLSAWGGSAADVRQEDGMYSSGGVGFTYTLSKPSTFTTMCDKDHTTKETFDLTVTNPGASGDGCALAFKWKVPDVSAYKFDAAYLLIKSKTTGTATLGQIFTIVRSRKFLGGTTSVCSAGGSTTAAYTEFNVEDLPDFYLLSVQNTNDRYFYANESVGGAEPSYKRGYVNFPLTAAELQNGSMREIGFFVTISSVTKVVWEVFEVALVLLKTVSIKDEIFTGIRGRIYNDTTMAGRYSLTATDYMANPVAVHEHVKRLQNWSEVGSTVDFGHAYSSGALIKTGASTAGSYDDSNLGPVGGTAVNAWKPRDLASARQVLTEDEAYTDALDTSLTRAMFAGSYRDKSGYECLRFLPAAEGGSLTTITLATVMGQIGPVVEARMQDIFCAPFVRYAYNYGSKKFDECLQVLNPNDGSFVLADGTTRAAGSGWHQEYTPGIDGTGNLQSGVEDGRVIWGRCNALWKMYHQIENPPTDISDQPWFVAYTSALWYLYQWVQWQGKRRVSLAVPYSVGRSMYVTQHVYLQLPHQTDSLTYECVIESLTLDKNAEPSVARLGLILLSGPTASAIYQDTDVGGATPIWQGSDVGGATPIYQVTDAGAVS